MSALGKRWLIAGAVLTSALAATPIAMAGEQVIGGRDATEDYSFMVSMQRPGGNHLCGGSLIAPNLVVTAAHCADGAKPGDFEVRIGSKTRSSGGTVAQVSAITVHPDFGTSPISSDIALLKLDKAVPEKPITIADGKGDPGTATRILGWGEVCFEQNCPPPEILQELDTKVVADDQCTKFTPGKEICTDSDTPDAMGCYGDSGGPQLRGRPGEWELIGATSRDGDADPQCATGPGIWTDVTTYRDWIAANS